MLKVFKGSVTATGRENTVVMTEARMKNNTNIGKTCFRLKLEPLSSKVFSFFSARKIASARVIGIIAKVHVSFTIVTTFRVLLP